MPSLSMPSANPLQRYELQSATCAVIGSRVGAVALHEGRGVSSTCTQIFLVAQMDVQ